MSMYNYLGTPNNNLICCICRAPFLDPLTSKLCSHTFCSSCILQAMCHSSQCPIDRTPLREADLERAPNIVRTMVDELEVECVYAPSRKEENAGQETHQDNDAPHSTRQGVDEAPGCKWTGERANLGAHLEVCEYAEGNKDRANDSEDDHSIRPSKGKERADVDGSQNESNPPSRSERALMPDTPDELDRKCPHTAFGCSYIATSSPSEFNGEDSSAIAQADIETHLTSCPYESIKGFFAVFSSTVSSQKKAIDESQRRENTLHATIQELKENEKRAKLVLEQNILLKKRLESLEGVANNLKKELANIKASLGPWGSGSSSSRNTPSFPAASSIDAGIDLSGMSRYTSPTATAASLGVLPSPPTSSFTTAPSGSPDRMSSMAHSGLNGGPAWAHGPQDIPPLNAATGLVSFSPRADETSSGNPGISSDLFASYFPNRGEEYPSGAPSHPSHRRTTSSAALPLIIPPLDTAVPLEHALHRLHASVASVATIVEGLAGQMEGVARRGEIGLANEAVRVGEEIGSLRAQIYGLRMLVHGLMVERGVGGRWPSAANPSGSAGMQMGDGDDEHRSQPFPPAMPMGMPPPPPPFFMRNSGMGMGMGPMGGPSITKL